MLSRRWLSPALAGVAFLIAFLQRPGERVADTKIDLHVDPVGFLAEVASVWNDSGGLGQVQAGQYSGYLFPMGPFFALGDLLGLPDWVVQRLWLGLLLALAAWGTVRLLDVLLDRERGPEHLVAGLLVIFNPYVVIFANRTTVTLLGYAALPWLLLIVHRGIRDPRGWWWAAAFALVVATTGGGVNAAVTAFVLLGPIVLAGYEATFGPARWREVGAFALRAGVLAVIASLWWIVPVAAHARYGLNFLPFTEAPGSIWDTTSMSEGVRLMGYWISYLGVGYSDTLVPYFDTSGTYLFEWPVVLATFAVPALAVAGLAVSLRWRYGPFFLALLLIALLVTAAGFPDGAPLRRALTFTYYRLEAVQFLRTTYKAAPLVSLSVAVLAGVAAGAAWRRLQARPPLRALLAGAAAVVLGLSALPLLAGRAIDEQMVYDVPREWERAADELDRELPTGSRAMVLPGQVFPFYDWGGTQDPILPALSDRPVASRYVVPYSDLHAVDLQFTLDALLTQRRAIPGQLGPLLHLAGVRSVVTGTDDDRVRSGSVEPGAAAEQLAADPALGTPERTYGDPRPLPRVRRYDLADARPLVRVEPIGPGLVVDGSAEALAGLAAFGALPEDRPILYAADASAAELRDAAAGGEVVVSDTNRKRVFISSRPNQNVGATLAAGDEVSRDGAVLNPFPDRGTSAQTVALLDGAAWISAPFSPQFPQFPEHRPYAAFDGDPETFWVADRYVEPEGRRVEIAFDHPRDVPYLDLLPQRESRTGIGTVEVAGRKFEVKPGWNRLRLGLRDVDRLELRILRLTGPTERRGPGAIAEVRIPGLRVRESLRTPLVAQDALRGRGLSHTALTYLFMRTMGDNPFGRAPEIDPDRGFVPEERNQEAALVREPGDGEEQIRRAIDPPTPRSYSAKAWVTVGAGVRDSAIDALIGLPPGFESSGRYEGQPGRRASSAFDVDDATAWIAPARGTPWIAWATQRPVAVRSLQLEPVPDRRIARPAEVLLITPDGTTPVLRVGSGGKVELPSPVRARRFRLEVLASSLASAEAVGIASVRGPGLPRVPRAATETFRSACGALRVEAGREAAALRVRGTLGQLEAGRPLRAEPCGAALRLAARPTVVETVSSLFRPALLRLRSAAPDGPGAPRGGGRVLDPGESGRGSYEGVRVDLDGAAWLVLGESFNLGWKASCGGSDLGEPRPIDGFANGWRVAPGCMDVDITFEPNRQARWSYAISGLGCLLMLAVLVLRRPRPPRPDDCGAWPGTPDARLGPFKPSHAAAVGLAAALAGGFLFALRAGVVIGPLVFLLLWRGVTLRVLIIAAALLLGLVVPALYVILMPDDLGGFNSEYPVDLIAAHWVSVAALVLLALALWRVLSTARARRGGRAPAPVAEAGARLRP
jgi:arabinofuranan 3-O-arabinosyltransferase